MSECLHGCRIKSQPKLKCNCRNVFHRYGKLVLFFFLSTSGPSVCSSAQHVRIRVCYSLARFGRLVACTYARFRYVNIDESTSTAINTDYASNFGVLHASDGQIWALVIFVTLPDEDAFHLPIFFLSCVSHTFVDSNANEALYTRAQCQLIRMTSAR